MKNFRKILAALLTAVLMVSMFSTFAFAATTATVKNYNCYVYLGDSVPAGDYCPGYKRGSFYSATWPIANTSYPQLVAKRVKSKKTYNMAKFGYRTQDLRMLLDDTYNGDELSCRLMPRVKGTYVTDNEIDWDGVNKLSQSYRSYIKKANLITLEIGSNDFIQPIRVAKDITMGRDSMMAKVPPVDNSDALSILASNYKKKRFVANMNRLEAAAISNYKTNFDVIITKIRELNPNAQIVVVGFYNPAYSWTGVGPLLDPIVNAGNRYLQSECPHRDEYTYVDILHIDNYSADPNSPDFSTNAHPNERGHKQICNAIIKALPEK